MFSDGLPEFLINLGNYKERLDHRLYIFVNALNVSFILHNNNVCKCICGALTLSRMPTISHHSPYVNRHLDILHYK